MCPSSSRSSSCDPRQQPPPTGTRVRKEPSRDSIPKLSAASLVLSKSRSSVRCVRETTVVILLSHYMLGYIATDNRNRSYRTAQLQSRGEILRIGQIWGDIPGPLVYLGTEVAQRLNVYGLTYGSK